jgi:hypothetical protein
MSSCRETGGDNNDGQVSILGVIYQTGNSTGFEDLNDQDIEGIDFFDAVLDGDLIAFKDVDSDGLADEVEFED